MDPLTKYYLRQAGAGGGKSPKGSVPYTPSHFF